MIEKFHAALQSIDLTQIIIAAAGGLGGAALWAQKRYQWFTTVVAARKTRRKTLEELPSRIDAMSALLESVVSQGVKTVGLLEDHSKTLDDQNRVLGTISAMVHGEMELDPTPRFICGDDGGNLNVNTAYARLVGCGRDELLGFGYQRFATAALNPGGYKAGFTEATLQHRSFESLVFFRRPDGKVVEAQVRIVPHPEHEPPAHYWVGIITSVKPAQ